MPINCEEYDNPEVNNATNPSSYGNHHSPVENLNVDWVSDCIYAQYIPIIYPAYANSLF